MRVRSLLASRSSAWASLASLALLGLPAFGLVGPWVLPLLVVGAAFALLTAAKGPWAERAVALEALAAITAASVASYAVAVGVTAPLSVPALLALALAAGLTAHGVGPREERAGGWRWERGVAFLLLIGAVTLVVSGGAFGLSPFTLAYAWLAAAYSFLPLAALTPLCLPRGRTGDALSLAALAALLAGSVWYVASTQVVLQQGQPLPWDELKYRMADPGSWAILREGLVSLPMALLTAGVFGGFFLASRALGRRSAGALVTLGARLVLLVGLGGRILVAHPHLVEPRLAERYLKEASAPWSPLHRRVEAEGVPIDAAAAREARQRVGPPLWEEGPAPLLANLRGRYPGRSVVLVLLESQRASYLDGFGEGSFGYRGCSPRLSELRGEGLFFPNYFASGFPTHTALWTLLTGLPVVEGGLPPGQRSPEATRLGRLPEFRSLGYQCDWICPASPRFDNWDRLLTAAGARWWINTPEVDGLPHDHWTSWGMPDEHLYEVALRRYRRVVGAGRPIFLGLLTVSNHRPYRYPPVDGLTFEADDCGGSRYADHWVHAFVRALGSLPPPQRPIVMITADTSGIEGLRDAEPLGIRNLEGLRIPGLLLLPDGRLAGQSFEGLLSHEDVLDLLFHLVAGETLPPPVKFVAHHRVAMAAAGGSLVTARSYLSLAYDRWFEIEGRWRLRSADSPSDQARLRAARDFLRAQEARLWRKPSPPPTVR